MDREQWGRFTDFGLTLFDSTGRQLGKDPLEYAAGRLSVDLATGEGPRTATVALFPGFADSADHGEWSATVSIRLHADSMVALEPVGAASGELTVPARRTVTRRFTLREPSWPLGEGFAPLAVVVARTGDQVWTREIGLFSSSGSNDR
jgi:hypothetical protein